MFGLHTESIILQSLLAAFAELACCERHATPESGMARRRRPQHVGLCAETPRFLNLLWAVQARRRRPRHVLGSRQDVTHVSYLRLNAWAKKMHRCRTVWDLLRSLGLSNFRIKPSLLRSEKRPLRRLQPVHAWRWSQLASCHCSHVGPVALSTALQQQLFLLIAYVCFVHCSIPVIPPGRAPPCSVTFDSYYRSR